MVKKTGLVTTSAAPSSAVSVSHSRFANEKARATVLTATQGTT